MSVYYYILAMAITTYLIRMLPLTVFKKPIKSRFIRSFLEYVPCACLTAMTFPAIFYSTNSILSGIVAFAVALLTAFLKRSLVVVAACSCASVFITEFIMRYLSAL